MKHLKNYLSILSMLFVMSLVIFTSCTGEKEKEEDLIFKVRVSSGEGGTAKVSNSVVLWGWEVTLTATSDPDYYFFNWTVNGKEVSISPTYTASITADTEIKANFKPFSGEEKNHTWVDLGLPSGIKWATCNVGATTPEEYGDYYAWGETTTKTNYDWTTYKYCNGSQDTMTKYCTNSENGTVDNKTTLELKDDAARVNWGGKWRMPTKAEIDELLDPSNCAWQLTAQDGVKGYKVTSKKLGNFIFLPAKGLWSSSLYANRSFGAYNLAFTSSKVDWGQYGRFNGLAVRAVCP